MKSRFTLMSSAGIVAVLASGATGCFWATTKSEGKSLRKDVTSLEERVSKKEADLTVKVDELKRVLDEATKLLKRNSADIGADLEALRNDIRVSTGLVSAAKNMLDEIKADLDRYKASNDERLAGLEQRLLALEGRGGTAGAPGSGNPDEIWTAATASFGLKKWDEAREGFKKLAVGFPTHDRADDAQYFRGETYFQQSDWELAIREYQKVFDKFATSSLADDALFRAAEAAERLKNCAEARAYLGVLKQKHPKSTLLKKAEAKDKDLKAAAKNKSKCNA